MLQPQLQGQEVSVEHRSSVSSRGGRREPLTADLTEPGRLNPAIQPLHLGPLEQKDPG